MGTEECSWGELALYLCDLGNAFWLLCQVQTPRFSTSAGTQSTTHLLHLSLNSSEARTLPLSRISPPEKGDTASGCSCIPQLWGGAAAASLQPLQPSRVSEDLLLLRVCCCLLLCPGGISRSC